MAKTWPWLCLRGADRGEVCADISRGRRFHPRDCLLASGPCTAPGGHTCHPVGKSPAKPPRAAWKIRCRESSSQQNKAKSGESGDWSSRDLLHYSQGWEPSKQRDHAQVCSRFPLLCPGKAGLLPGQGNPSLGSTDDNQPWQCHPWGGGRSGPAQAEDSKGITVLCKPSHRASGVKKPCSSCALGIF